MEYLFYIGIELFIVLLPYIVMLVLTGMVIHVMCRRGD